jgi:hypothetical protein
LFAEGGIVRKSLLFAAVLLAITAQASGHTYLLRGLAGIFPPDWTSLTKNWSNVVTAPLARLQKGNGPIIIMGHSLGADAAIYMAEKMKTLGALSPLWSRSGRR